MVEIRLRKPQRSPLARNLKILSQEWNALFRFETDMNLERLK